VCNACYIVCLFVLFCLSVVCYFVCCEYFCASRLFVPLPQGKKPFYSSINNNSSISNNKNNTFLEEWRMNYCVLEGDSTVWKIYDEPAASLGKEPPVPIKL
jgi:hypothetical protein